MATPAGRRRQDKENFLVLASMSDVWIGISAVLWLLLLVTLGVLSIRKGHWVMFIVGLFLPIFWLIGALMPRRGR